MGCITGLGFRTSVSPQIFEEIWTDTSLAEAIDQAIEASGRREKRRRVLPADLVVRLVLLLSAYRDTSVDRLLMRVGHHLRRQDPDLPLEWVTQEALSHARARLGKEPLKRLFESLAGRIEPERSFFGLRPWIIDGTELTVPDTKENAYCFGRPVNDKGAAAFPNLSMVMLLDADHRCLRDVVIGRYAAPERPACLRLARHLGPEDVVLFDAGISSTFVFQRLIDRGIHYIARISDNWDPQVIEKFDQGDSLVEVEVYKPVRGTRDASGRALRRKIGTHRFRMVEYQAPGHARIRIATSLLDPNAYAALDLARGYHKRWDVELANKEIKTHSLNPPAGSSPTCLRSRTPAGVRQEAYGTLVIYNLIRTVIAAAARAAAIDPLKISFLKAREALFLAIPGLLQAKGRTRERLWEVLLRDIARCVLKRSRRHRRYPRVVKRRESQFPTKRGHHKEERIDLSTSISLIETG